MLIALPNQDGSFTCTLFLPYEGEPSFEQLRAPADVQRFFGEQFPDAVPLLPALTKLELDNAKLTDRAAAALAASPHLSGLTTLNLWANQIGSAGAAA